MLSESVTLGDRPQLTRLKVRHGAIKRDIGDGRFCHTVIPMSKKCVKKGPSPIDTPLSSA